MGIFPCSESFSLCAGDGHACYVCSRLALYAQSIAPIQSINYGTTMTSVTRLLETALYVADLDRSCDFYERVLGLRLDVGTTAEKEQKRFQPLQIPGGQILLLFP